MYGISIKFTSIADSQDNMYYSIYRLLNLLCLQFSGLEHGLPRLQLWVLIWVPTDWYVWWNKSRFFGLLAFSNVITPTLFRSQLPLPIMQFHFWFIHFISSSFIHSGLGKMGHMISTCMFIWLFRIMKRRCTLLLVSLSLRSDSWDSEHLGNARPGDKYDVR